MAVNFTVYTPEQLRGFAQQFLEAYYGFLDGPAASRSAIAQLYNDNCQMTYEGDKFVGKAAVEAKFATLHSIMTMVHDISSVDVQAVSENAVFIVVLGQFKTEDQEHALGFTQTFFVMGMNGRFMILNDIFRLALFNNA
ncbi:uncharacterized protein LOC132543664 [Ylistrum balloti]|uniref:uncharacterized protein LOC132543664 n=1 Tax=Ylistrum balloti TaxID=509963 RepID=UPI0029058541|nr:uncharacterized protein LOC132543664 [Ylistrum balloti]